MSMQPGKKISATARALVAALAFVIAGHTQAAESGDAGRATDTAATAPAPSVASESAAAGDGADGGTIVPDELGIDLTTPDVVPPPDPLQAPAAETPPTPATAEAIQAIEDAADAGSAEPLPGGGQAPQQEARAEGADGGSDGAETTEQTQVLREVSTGGSGLLQVWETSGKTALQRWVTLGDKILLAPRTDGIDIEAVYPPAGPARLVLLSINGRIACEMSFVVVEIDANGLATVSKEFGNCSRDVEVTGDASAWRVSIQNGARADAWIYGDGKLYTEREWSRRGRERAVSQR
jgi:hypothetical protein